MTGITGMISKNMLIAAVAAAVVAGGATYAGVKYYYENKSTQSVAEYQGYYGHGYGATEDSDWAGQNAPIDEEERLADIPKGTLTEQEKEDILHMREEEKLARDVYLTLYDKWGLPVFKNIANSEQRHTDSVKELIDRYGLEDPVKDDSIGAFTDPKLKDLYNQLVALGSKSEVDALKVGATIEDLDIYDLDNALARTDNDDIKLIYESLRSGSYNHMRAFVGQLKSRGSDYSPQYISVDEYNKILSSTMGRGYGNAMLNEDNDDSTEPGRGGFARLNSDEDTDTYGNRGARRGGMWQS